MQDQWSLHVLLRHLDLGENLQEAIDAPEFHTDHFPSSFHPRQAEPRSLSIESRFGDEVIEDLRRRGHDVTVTPPWSLGRVSAAGRDADGTLKAAANARGDAGLRRRPLEQEPHHDRVPELAVRAAVLLHATTLLDEAELAVERDPGVVVREDLERELVQAVRRARGRSPRRPAPTPRRGRATPVRPASPARQTRGVSARGAATPRTRRRRRRRWCDPSRRRTATSSRRGRPAARSRSRLALRRRPRTARPARAPPRRGRPGRRMPSRAHPDVRRGG